MAKNKREKELKTQAAMTNSATNCKITSDTASQNSVSDCCCKDKKTK